MTVWISVLWQMSIHMAKKWSEMVVNWSFMRDVHFETVFNTFSNFSCCQNINKFIFTSHQPPPFWWSCWTDCHQLCWWVSSRFLKIYQKKYSKIINKLFGNNKQTIRQHKTRKKKSYRVEVWFDLGRSASCSKNSRKSGSVRKMGWAAVRFTNLSKAARRRSTNCNI